MECTSCANAAWFPPCASRTRISRITTNTRLDYLRKARHRRESDTIKADFDGIERDLLDQVADDRPRERPGERTLATGTQSMHSVGAEAADTARAHDIRHEAFSGNEAARRRRDIEHFRGISKDRSGPGHA